MKRNLLVVLAALASAISCGIVFLLALHRQFALVEIAASLATGAEVYLLSSSLGDLLEERKEPSRLKLAASVGLLGVIVVIFVVAKYTNRIAN